MRLLSLSVAFLVLANVLVFLWPAGADSAGHLHRAKNDINPHFVRLNKEIEDDFYNSTENKESTEPFSLDLSRLASNERGATPGSLCYRLGPFVHNENYELAQAVLYNADINFSKTSRASKETSVFRVYIGPYDTLAQAQDMRSDLKRNKILDHFIRKEQNGQFIISLGIYTTIDSANNALALFNGQFDGVKLIDEQVVLPESYWLHFKLQQADRVRKELASIDWGESAAKMGLYQCQS